MKSQRSTSLALFVLMATLSSFSAGVPTASAASASAAVCNTYCDARDPAQSTQDRGSVTAEVAGRSIALHFDDAAAMGWASIDNGGSGDRVWLDRSMDGGRTWGSGSRLGDTAVPDGGQGWRTQMYNVDDWNTEGVGALRACGQPTGGAIACTAWARTTWNAGSRSTAAATALMMSFDRSSKLFGGNGWWTAANALTAMIDNSRISGMGSYTYAIAETYDKNINAQEGSSATSTSTTPGGGGSPGSTRTT